MSSEIELAAGFPTSLALNRSNQRDGVMSGAFNLNSDLEAGKEVLAKDETQLRTSSGNVPKVREQLRSADEDSYTPHSVPIGPYHRNRPSPWIVKEKLRYVGFMQCLSEKRNGGGLNGLVEEMESRAREWYGDGVDHMTPEELARMLLHDGCYLLGWLGNYPDAPQTCNDNNTVFRDILYLIENQVPFFLLEDINRRATGRGDTSRLLRYMATYIQSLLNKEGYISKGKQRLSEQPSHLLHLVHTYFHPTNGQMADPPKRPCQLLHRVHAYFSPTSFSPSADPRPAKRDTGRWRRATEYCMHANVQFRRRDLAADVTSILDVRLKGGTLDIPCLQVDSRTWTLLRNLMALEEHAEMPERPVTAYCIFMSQVACTEEDVRLLVDAKIVQHFQGSDKIAAQGFANLCKGVVMDVDDIQRNYLKPIWHDLEKLCDSKARNFKGSFRHNYCSSRLHQVAFGITAFLAFCQLLQTIYAPIAYHFPQH